MRQRLVKKEEPDLEGIIKFMSKMQRIDRTGQDAGWTFEGLIFDDNNPPTDVRVSLRGEYDLIKSAQVAMRILSGVEL